MALPPLAALAHFRATRERAVRDRAPPAATKLIRKGGASLSLPCLPLCLSVALSFCLSIYLSVGLSVGRSFDDVALGAADAADAASCRCHRRRKGAVLRVV